MLYFKNVDYLEKNPNKNIEKIYNHIFTSIEYKEKALEWLDFFVVDIPEMTEEEISQIWCKPATLCIQAHGGDFIKNVEDVYGEEYVTFAKHLVAQYQNKKEEERF